MVGSSYIFIHTHEYERENLGKTLGEIAVMQVRISQPTKSAMQSGDGDGKWHLEFVRPSNSRYREELMARTSSRNMMSEVNLSFNSLEDAEKFAKDHNYNYEIIKPKKRRLIKQSYADNFC